MSDVTQSPFLQALGYAIINSLWQFALLWLIYVSVNTFLKLSSHQKYATGLLMQLGGFTWFTITFSSYFKQFTRFEEIYFLQQNKLSFALTKTHSSSLVERFFSAIKQTENFLPYLSIAYLLILIFLVVKWITVYRVTQKIKTVGVQKIDVSWRLFVKQLSNQLGIKREVKIFLSELVTTPLTIGFFKPLILIPLASLNQLNTYQMEAIILHELAHIKRFDYLFNLFIAIIDITLFFNPFTILISRQIRRERENCCDDWVLQYEYNPASYATALLQIATNGSSSRLALGAADNTNILLSRIKRMIEKKESTFFNYRYQLLALLVMLTVAGSLALLSSIHNKNKSSVSASSRQVIVKPMAEINNPLFNPDFFIASEEEKGTESNKWPRRKVTTNNFRSDTLNERKITEVSEVIINKQKQNRKSVPVEKECIVPENLPDPAIPGNPEYPPTEEVSDIEVSNLSLETAAAAIEKQHVSLEEQLKQLIINLAEEKKGVIGRRELLAIKAAIDQLKKATAKQDLSRQRISNSRQERNFARSNEFRINQFLNQLKFDQLKCLTDEFRLKTEEFKKQEEKLNKQNLFFRYNQRMPEVISQLPFVEKGHSFSFELSTDPDLKVVLPRFHFIPEKVKKTDKKYLEKENKPLNPANNFPALDGLIQKNINQADNILVIKI